MAQSFQQRAANGHWYAAFEVPGGITWADAQVQARARNGYLACIADAAENQFVFGLIQRPSLWFVASGPTRVFGPWIGGFQPSGAAEPAGGWSWVDGSAFSYTRWETNEPNNLGTTGESVLHYFALGNVIDSTWNDFRAEATVRSYVVEVDCLYITSQPADDLACVGSTVALSVEAGASGGVTYQWRRNAVAIPVSGVGGNPTARSATLVLSNFQATDAGQYDCVLTATCGTATTRSVTVAFAPACCDDIDFNNNDVFPEEQDVIDFFNVLAGSTCSACNDIDFNNNGVFPEEQDVIDFFNVLAGGNCP
jgi:hypothetical protein